MEVKPKENINTWITQLNTDSKAAISVDCVVFGYDETGLKILLIDCNMPPHVGQMSIVGDLVRSYETLDQAASRILEQRTGLSNMYMEQVKAFSEPDRHPLGRVITLAYYSLVKIADYEIVDKEDKQLKWVDIND
ncbi:MAG: NUDIX domain-containing protein, partial [Bacteroidota bacterium]